MKKFRYILTRTADFERQESLVILSVDSDSFSTSAFIHLTGGFAAFPLSELKTMEEIAQAHGWTFKKSNDGKLKHSRTK